MASEFRKSPSPYSGRSCVFSSFPVAVCGKLGTNVTSLGSYYFAVRLDEISLDVLAPGRRAFLQLDQQERAFLPGRMRRHDHHGFLHRRWAPAKLSIAIES